MATTYVVKTKMGSFFYPPDYQIAVMEGSSDSGLKYKFPFEMKPGSKVLIRKSVADGLDLKEDVIPSLWAQSRDYRLDRRYVFAEGMNEISDATRLSQYLRRNARNMGMDDLSALNHFYSIISKVSNYKSSTIRNWMAGDTMFPQGDPNALIYLAHELGDSEMENWAYDLTTMDPRSNPINRLRALHSGIMSALATPTGENFGRSNERSDKTQRIIGVSDFIKLIKDYYGGDILEELTVPANILEVREVEYNNSRHKYIDATKEPGVLVKSLLGFSSIDTDSKLKIISRYRGRARSDYIEEALSERKKLLSDKVVPMVLKHARHNDVTYGEGKISDSSSLPYLGNMIIDKMAEAPDPDSLAEEIGRELKRELEGTLFFIRDKRKMDIFTKYTNEDSFYELYKSGKALGHPYFDHKIDFLKSLYGPIEKFSMNERDFISTFSDVGSYGLFIKDLEKEVSDSGSERTKSVRTDFFDAASSFMRDLFNKHDFSSILNEHKEIAKDLPMILGTIQTKFTKQFIEFYIENKPPIGKYVVKPEKIRQGRAIRRLRDSYGISSFYPIHEDSTTFSELLKNR